MSFSGSSRPARSARYPSEDISPTSGRELLGWYAYAVAAEVFAVVAVGAFLPLTLEELAREHGVLWSDKSTPCSSRSRAGGAATTSSGRSLVSREVAVSNQQCIVTLLGAEITTASFAFYTSAAAVLVQAVALICFSSFADHGPHRKRLLVAFAYTGALASALFVFITPNVYFLGSLLVIIGVTCLGSSFTLLNAFLPVLVSHHNNPLSSPSDIALEPLNPDGTAAQRHDPEKLAHDLQLSAKISARGVGIGYASSVFVEFLSIGLLVLLNKTSIPKTNPTLPKRLVMLLCGVWWAIFTIPTVLFLRPRPGPPIPYKIQMMPGDKGLFFYLIFSLFSFWKTLKRALKLHQVVLFLVAWFLLSDAIATIGGTAILFAKTELHMSTIPIVLLSITSISSGIIGAAMWPILSRRFGLPPKLVILLCIGLMEIIPLYGLLAYLPFVKNLGVLGLQNAWEIYPIGVLHGIVMGGLSAYCRSFYSHLIPPGSEAAFYALYAVTDKGSSTIGPVVVGIIVDYFGTIRPAFGFLAVLILCPLPLVWWVDVERGRGEAVEMAKLGVGLGVEYDEVRREEEWDQEDLLSEGDEVEAVEWRWHFGENGH